MSLVLEKMFASKKFISAIFCVMNFFSVASVSIDLRALQNGTFPPSQRFLYPIQSLINNSSEILLEIVSISNRTQHEKITTPKDESATTTYESLEADQFKIVFAANENNKTRTGIGYMISIAALLVVFFCCTVGVFGIVVLCCVACADAFIPRQGPAASGINDANNNNDENEDTNVTEITSLTFVSSHRHPWSPGADLEAFCFNSDLPPSYEDLSPKVPSLPTSPPPPYSPSFQLGAQKK